MSPHRCRSSKTLKRLTKLGADPDRCSYVSTINIIRRQVLNQAAISPSALNAAVRETIVDIHDRSCRSVDSGPAHEWSGESPSATPT